jgi:hypothetical protein
VENGRALRDLDAEIAQAEERLAELEQLHTDAAGRLTELNRLRSAQRTALDTGGREGDQRSPASKVKLFRDLFTAS